MLAGGELYLDGDEHWRCFVELHGDGSLTLFERFPVPLAGGIRSCKAVDADGRSWYWDVDAGLYLSSTAVARLGEALRGRHD